MQCYYNAKPKGMEQNNSLNNGGNYMWYLINQNGERCKAVETEKEAIKELRNNSEYVSYVYSNNIFIM